MEHIGEVITQSDLKSLKSWAEKTAPQTGYFAPTFYKLASAKLTAWNIYKTAEDVVRKWAYLNNLKGGADIKPAGTIKFKNNGTAETAGINVDFFVYIPLQGWTNIPYAGIRTIINNTGLTLPIRFYKTDGTGPYFTILDNRFFSISATKIDKVSPEKLAAYDNFYRSLQALKANYNNWVSYVDFWSKKKKNAKQQQMFDEALVVLGNMREEIRQIQGVTITFKNGQISGIGAIPLIYIVAFVISALVLGGWAISKIVEETNKTKRVTESYDFQKWNAEKINDLGRQLQRGEISQESYNRQVTELENSSKAAQENVKEELKDKPGFLDKVENILLLGLGIYAVSKFVGNGK